MGLILLLGAASFSGFVYFKEWTFKHGTDPERLQMLWIQDYKELKTSGHFPDAFFDLKSVQVFAGTEKAKEWIKKIKSPFRYSSDGRYRLDILVLSWEDEEDGKSGGIIQYDLYDDETQNLVTEFGRTYVLRDNKDDGLSEAKFVPPKTPPPAQKKKD